LIISVIHGIVGYWIQSFYFPVSVCKQLDKLCANVLWKGQMHAWNWSSIYQPKSEEVGLRRIHDINQAASLTRLWNLCSSNSIWPSWM